MDSTEEFIQACRRRPRDIARLLVASLAPAEVLELIERLQTEGAIMVEFREMLEEGRRVSHRDAA